MPAKNWLHVHEAAGCVFFSPILIAKPIIWTSNTMIRHLLLQLESPSTAILEIWRRWKWVQGKCIKREQGVISTWNPQPSRRTVPSRPAALVVLRRRLVSQGNRFAVGPPPTSADPRRHSHAQAITPTQAKEMQGLLDFSGS
jgi:hypothetical protein